MAFGFPAEYTEFVPVGATERRTAIETAMAALDEMGLAHQDLGDTLRARVRMSGASWGETLTISAGDGIEPAYLRVTSRCRGLQLFDWGKNKRNVHEFLSIFRRKLLLNPSHPAGHSVAHYDPGGKTPLQRALDARK